MKRSKLLQILWLCLFMFSLGSSPLLAQSTKVSVKLRNGTIKELFSQIEEQSNYKFSYREEVIKNVDKQFTVSKENSSIESILNEVLAQTNLSYSVVSDESIVITDKKSSSPSNQSRTPVEFKGKIIDANGLPIVGATVIIKESTTGSVTDVSGGFTFKAKEGDTVVCSCIGYEDLEYTITATKTDHIITLEEGAIAVDEVVVVGYGVQKVENVTGSITSVTAEAIEDRPIRSVKDALMGNAVGVTVTSSNGQPGNFGTIKVRGETSLNSGGALVLVDGMPSDMDNVNPNDIESVSVLKDAASAAIYGARAAEGVIIITTKRGRSSKTTVEYSNNFSFNTPTRIPQSTTALQHAELANLAFTNAGLNAPFSAYMDQIRDPNTIDVATSSTDWVYTADVDWIDMMMDHSFQQQHNVSVSRRQENLSYLFSVGWLDQNGMFSEYGPDNYDRYNLRSNVSFDLIKDKLIFDSKISFSRSKQMAMAQYAAWSPTYITFIQSGPNMPIYDSNGNWARNRMQLNVIQTLEEGGFTETKEDALDGMFTLNYKPIKDLSIKAIGGIRITEGGILDWHRQFGKYGPEGLISMTAGQSGDNYVQNTTTDNNYYTGQFLVDYNKTIGKHEISALAGWSAELNEYSSLYAYRNNIIGNELPAINLGSSDAWKNSASSTAWGLLSAFMRFNYAYDSKYLFEANVRTDGSSRFSDQHKWGVFPSFSAGWIISNEQFMESQNIFDKLKLRVSWGQMGNQNGLGLYDHIPQYTVSGYYPFISGLGQWAKQSSLPSQERTWETVEMSNIAVEMGFLDNRLTASAEYYIKRNKDMLVSIEVPSIVGITVPTGNYGELEVKGYELTIGWRDQVGEFNYNVQLNFADRKDVLVDYGVEFSGFTSGVNQIIQGYSVGAIFGYKTDGYFATDAEAAAAPAYSRALQSAGDIKYLDLDGDGSISAPGDLEYLGTTQPRYEFGVNFNASWRGIDMSMLLQGVGKRSFYLDYQAMQPFTDTWSNYSYEHFNDYWTLDNQDSLLPRLYAGNKFNYQTSDHWIQNAGYVRIKNLQIGYTFNENISRKLGMERLRVYFSGENLWESSGLLKYYDPELTEVSGYMYPIMRSFSAGLNVVF